MTRIANAGVAWEKACCKLLEAERIDPVGAPGAVVHSAYYAMHHAARAVLWEATGKAAVRHGQVVQDFGLLAVNRADAEMKLAGRALNKMLDDRNLWDYEADNPSEDQARDAARVAREFLSVCVVKLGFPSL